MSKPFFDGQGRQIGSTETGLFGNSNYAGQIFDQFGNEIGEIGGGSGGLEGIAGIFFAGIIILAIVSIVAIPIILLKAMFEENFRGTIVFLVSIVYLIIFLSLPAVLQPQGEMVTCETGFHCYVQTGGPIPEESWNDFMYLYLGLGLFVQLVIVALGTSVLFQPKNKAIVIYQEQRPIPKDNNVFH